MFASQGVLAAGELSLGVVFASQGVPGMVQESCP